MEDVNSQISNLSAAVNMLNSKKADLQLAEADLKRGKELLPQRAMSQEAVDTRERAVKADAAAVAQALDQIYAIRVGLGLPREPAKGGELTEVPPDLDQNFSTVRDALGDLFKSAAQLGYSPSSFDAAPKPAIEEFYQQDKNRNLNAIYTKLIKNSPIVTQAEAKLQEAKSDLDQAQLNLRYTRIRAPFPGIVVKRYSHLGDFATPGVAILSMYNPDLTYVTANLEEDRLPGVAPGNSIARLPNYKICNCVHVLASVGRHTMHRYFSEVKLLLSCLTLIIPSLYTQACGIRHSIETSLSRFRR